MYVRVSVCMSRVRVHKAAKTMKKECTGILYVHTDIFNACLLLRSLLDAYYLLLLCFSSCCLFVYSCIVHISWEQKNVKKIYVVRGNKTCTYTTITTTRDDRDNEK